MGKYGNYDLALAAAEQKAIHMLRAGRVVSMDDSADGEIHLLYTTPTGMDTNLQVFEFYEEGE